MAHSIAYYTRLAALMGWSPNAGLLLSDQTLYGTSTGDAAGNAAALA